MEQAENLGQEPAYDPRWFIWTIVFLVATGVSLVSYIMLSDTSSYESQDIVVHRRALTEK